MEAGSVISITQHLGRMIILSALDEIPDGQLLAC